MIRHAAVFTCLVAASSACLADDLYTGKYAVCMDRSGGVTADMIDCMLEETRTQDVRLNGAYKELSAQLVPPRRQQLVAAQRLWIQYRDANCTFYADPDGGTFAVVASNECVLRETAERAKELGTLGSLD